MKNREIAELFNRIATLLEIKEDNVFKIRAYRKAADVLESLSEDIGQLVREEKTSSITGIGKALSEKIAEYVNTGKITAYEHLKKEIPETILDVVRIPSIGPRKAKLFYDQLKITDVDTLQEAAKDGRLLKLPGIQEKTIENIRRGLQLLKQSQERMDIALATYVAEAFVDQLKKRKEVKKISVAGSLRRQKETIRDIDILIVSDNPVKVMDYFVGLPGVAHINVKGETKASILTKDNIQVDLRVVEEKSFGAALLYFTGSKNFNVKLRQRAIKKKMKVNEYGLFSVAGKKEKYLCGKKEQGILQKLDMPYVPPEIREDIGEEELFTLKKTPTLIDQKDIKGDLHVHSVWSDGDNSILELAAAARQKGYSYLAISDHSASLRVAGGLSVADLKKKKNEIERINKKLKGFRVLFGTEVEIDSQGNLDYNGRTLREFDIVIAAIHSGFQQNRQQITKRLVKVCQNKYVHVIAHPMGIHLGKRRACDIDLKEVCRAAKDTNTFLEINAFPFRLDLDSANAYFAHKHGVRFVINTDAHNMEHFDLMRFGVAIARRAWLRKEDVINTLTTNQLMKILKRL